MEGLSDNNIEIPKQEDNESKKIRKAKSLNFLPESPRTSPNKERLSYRLKSNSFSPILRPSDKTFVPISDPFLPKRKTNYSNFDKNFGVKKSIVFNLQTIPEDQSILVEPIIQIIFADVR